MRKFLLLTALSSSLTLLDAALPIELSSAANIDMFTEFFNVTDINVSVTVGKRSVHKTFSGIPVEVARRARAFVNGNLMQLNAIVENTQQFEATATSIVKALGKSGEEAGEIYALLIPAFSEQVAHVQRLNRGS